MQRLPRGLSSLRRRAPRVLVCGAALVVSLVAGCAGLRSLSGPHPPRLIVLIVVDQLRPDRLSPGQPDGFGRLQREGRIFARAKLDHAFTETCPGHAAASTGRHPSGAGIPANRFLREGSLEPVYCVLDDTERGALLSAGSGSTGGSGMRPGMGRSPSLLRSDGLADWLKAANPKARVHAVAGKDRAAVLLGGRGADGAWWVDLEGEGGITTSRFYRDALPAWAAGWDRGRLLAGVPGKWVHPARDPEGRIRADDYPAEDPRASRTSPHPLVDAQDPARSIQRMAASPYLDRVVLEFALELVDAEALGLRDDGAVDLLAIGLSATDFIGHLYGPFSQESRAALADLDEAMGEFLAELEARLGEGRVGVVLTADHGVLPLPEWVQEVDLPENACPVPGGRASGKAIEARLVAAADRALGDEEVGRGPWLVVQGSRLHFNRDRLEAVGASSEKLESALREALSEEPAVERVLSRSEIESTSGGCDHDRELRRLLRHSLVPGRGPDLVVAPRRGCLISDRVYGTSHGSPHDYDRRLPLVFWGPGVEPGVDEGSARLVDLAPTLAGWLGIEVPIDLDGRALPLRSP